MSNNRTFFKNAKEGHMTLKDIFSDVLRKHTPEESARVLIAGTALTTPEESEMLSGWQKPFLFARFFLITVICMALCLVLSFFSPGGTDALLVGMALMVPMTTLILAWEMNVPRTISLMEVLKIVAVGGLLSLIFTLLLMFAGINFEDAAWAPVVEEPGKLLVIWLILRRKNYKYILEGVLIGMAVGTGFAIIETMNYILGSVREGMIMSMAEIIVNLANRSGADAAIQVLINMVSSQMDALSQTMLNEGAAVGMNTAIQRSFNGIVGHGVYAALYGGGLLMAKQAEPVKPAHLLNINFLKYFAAAFLIHFLNNSSLRSVFPWIIPGKLMSWSLVKAALGAIFLLPLLKAGVNQIVEITISYHGGRVTRAVNYEAESISNDFGTQSAVACRIEFISGPMAGQRFSLQDNNRITVGRNPNNSIPVAGLNSVSGQHCSVGLRGSMILVTDLGSTNGTYVGAQRLVPNQETVVPDGATVYLGNQQCAFRVSVR